MQQSPRNPDITKTKAAILAVGLTQADLQPFRRDTQCWGSGRSQVVTLVSWLLNKPIGYVELPEMLDNLARLHPVIVTAKCVQQRLRS